MDLITIYKDEKTKIQTLDSVIEYLEYIANTYKRLSPIQMEEVLSLVLNIISQEQSLKGKKIITSSQISILTRKKIFDLLDDYKELEDALLLLSECFDRTSGKVSLEWKNNVKSYIKAHYFLTF